MRRSFFISAEGPADENIFSLNGDNDVISQSFNGGLGNVGLDEHSGLADAARNHFGRGFAALSFYYHFWKQLITDEDQLNQYALYLATSLTQFITAQFTGLDEGSVTNLTDTGDHTEAVRRTAGFLAMMQSLAPQIISTPSASSSSGSSQTSGEPDSTSTDAQNRASLVIDRVVNHLKSYKLYYLVNFLAYIDRQTKGLGRQQFVQWVIRNLPAAPQPVSAQLSAWLPLLDRNGQFLDVRASFIDGVQIIIPSVVWFPISASAIEEGSLSQSVDVSIPVNGVHIEAAPGNCVLADVPTESDSSVNANFSVVANE